MRDARKWVPFADLDKSQSRVLQPQAPVVLPFVRLDEHQARESQVSYVIVGGKAYPVTGACRVRPSSDGSGQPQ